MASRCGCRWVPQANLSSSLSLAFTGGPVGIITALVVAPPLISNLGWESVFWMCGASGLAWAAWWHPSVAEEPPSLVAAYAEADVAEVAAPKPESQLKISDVPWGRFATNVPVLALLGVHCSANAGEHLLPLLLCCTWLEAYLLFNLVAPCLGPRGGYCISFRPAPHHLQCIHLFWCDTQVSYKDWIQ